MDAPTHPALADGLNPHASAPIATFTKAHMRFVATLHAALDLPRLLEAAQRARTLSADVVKMFERGVVTLHLDEEKDLFPAVQAAARSGEERHKVESMVSQLVREHQELNLLWSRLEQSVRAAAAGEIPTLDTPLLEDLVGHFFAHAHFEEEYFLPLAEEILRRDGKNLDALTVALHGRPRNW